ncbi:MAG: YicC family protein [Desulfobulbaceae bacterium]|nr:YicC family protein [Desulfobulbaceae bacterium]
MIRSMTGFGRAEIEHAGTRWWAEIRCINNRFFDAKIKLPHGCQELEDRLRKQLGRFFQRGRVDLTICRCGEDNAGLQVRANSELARQYWDALRRLAVNLGLDEQPALAQICAFPDVLSREQAIVDVDELWPALAEMLDQAIAGCEAMRQREGAALAADLQGRLRYFARVIAAIDAEIPILLQQRQEQLRQRLDKLLAGVDIDPMRLAQEVAILADKSDVTEEIVRLRSHLRQFTAFLEENAAVGRKLDFLVQELLREVNTLGSKIADAAIAQRTVELKSELEKIREQIQNIE